MNEPMTIIAACLMSLITAQASSGQAPVPPSVTIAQTPPRTVAPEAGWADFVIGPEDVLGIVFWREPDMTGDVTVRPDGRITIPVLGELQAAGKRPQELQAELITVASKYVSGVNVVVIVRTINSRKIFVTGRVTAPGKYPLMGSLSVMQALALAGGLTEYADPKSITILRTENGQSRTLSFNYQDVARGRSLEQNVQLRPGDTVVVP